MSDQQPPYGPPQQPYGQPQYGQPQYGPGQPPYGQQYPQQYGGHPPPPPPRKNRTGLIVAGVIGAVVLGLLAVVGIVALILGDDDTAGGSAPAASQPSSDPSATPSVQKRGCYKCFPGVTMAAAQAAVKAKGYACKPDKSGAIECLKDHGNRVISFRPSVGDDELVGTVGLLMFSGGPGDYPQGSNQTLVMMRSELPTVLAIVFTDPSLRAQAAQWFQGNLGTCNPSRSTISGFDVICQRPTSISVTGKKGTFSSWSSDVSVDGTRVR